MAQLPTIREILRDQPIGTTLTVRGWVRTFRNDQFITVSDGSCIHAIQVVIKKEDHLEEKLKRIQTGTTVSATGVLGKSLGKGQAVELVCDQLEILGDCDPQEYPIQMKRHSLEFLREKAHLRFRTNTFGAVFRLRHHLAFAIHKFFNDRGFFYLHSPIITGSDAEGAGEMFRVTSLNLEEIAKTGKLDNSLDFFGKTTNLTVSGQLEAELAALALGKVYTFGPTFRAENSNTSRHLAEFWMIEPEVAFNDIYDNMDLGEDCLKFCIQYALDHAREDLEFLQEREINEDKQKPVEERQSMPLIQRLEMVTQNKFERITYTEAIDILLQSNHFKKKKFKYPVEWGIDMQSEHERYLVEKHFQRPVIITGYPAAIKAFYMRLNDPDSQGRNTVAAMDILVPGIGEIIGGSQREERYEVLVEKCRQFNIPEEHIWWYLETRKFGTCVHAGFGLGFERLIMFVTGMGNIRDVVPFPRTPLNAEF
ncbi:MAG: asparagine--tRNA ligase [Flavobacteriales bacterium]|nr:asparagine--tRNA ligase [Flavobacteriales bacterium]